MSDLRQLSFLDQPALPVFHDGQEIGLACNWATVFGLLETLGLDANSRAAAVVHGHQDARGYHTGETWAGSIHTVS